MSDHFKKYRKLGVAELLEDPAFRAWAKGADPAADADWQTFLATYPVQRPKIAMAKFMLSTFASRTADEVPTVTQRDSDFARLMQRTQPQLKVRSRRSWLPAAAAAIVLLIIGGTAWNYLGQNDLRFATGNGEQQEILLADGTTVVLNANSSLYLPDGSLGGESRTVELVGEAFFAVNKHQKEGTLTPFFVRTDDLVVKVLGTRFNVKGRQGTTRVFLEEGSVAIDWENEEVDDLLLHPGEMAVYDPLANKTDLLKAVSVAEQMAWTKGHFSFEHRLLSEVLIELSNIYGVTFQCANAALEQREVSSAGIPVNDLTLAIGLIEKALDLKIETTDKLTYHVSEN